MKLKKVSSLEIDSVAFTVEGYNGSLTYLFLTTCALVIELLLVTAFFLGMMHDWLGGYVLMLLGPTIYGLYCVWSANARAND